MNPFVVGGIAFVGLFGGAVIGMTFSAALPGHHLNADSRDAIKLATAVVATLAALALGLLVASAKSSFDAADNQLRTMAARMVLLDRVLAHYGPETQEARPQIRQILEIQLRRVWVEGLNPNADRDTTVESIQDKLR